MGKHIDFSNKSAKWDCESDIKELIQLIESKLNATTFDIHGNTLGVSAAECIGKALGNCCKIKRCILNDLFTGRLKTEIAPALKHISSGLMAAQVKLVELNVSDNAFGPNGIVGITELLASPACFSLKYLKMHNLGLGHEGCRRLCESLAKGKEASDGLGPNLVLFWAGRNRLEDVGAKLLESVLSPMGSLEEIAIYQNGIGIYGDEGSEHLANIIQNNPGIKKIDFSDNSIRPVGMKNICSSLCITRDLTDLIMNDCIIKSKGLKYLSLLLEDTNNLPLLENISLNGNELHRKETINFILNIGPRSEVIKKINLDDNEFGEDGLDEVLSCLESVSLLDKIEKPADFENNNDENFDNFVDQVKSYGFSGNQDPDEVSDEEEQDSEEDYDDEDDYYDDDEETSEIDEKEVTITQEVFSSATCTPNKSEKARGLFGFLDSTEPTKNPPIISNFSFSFVPKDTKAQEQTVVSENTQNNTLFKPSLFSSLSSTNDKKDLLSFIQTNFKNTGKENYWASDLPEDSLVDRLSTLIGNVDLKRSIESCSKQNLNEIHIETLVHALVLAMKKEKTSSSTTWQSCNKLLTKLVNENLAGRNALLVHIGAIKADSSDKSLCSIVGLKDSLSFYLDVVQGIMKTGISIENMEIFKCIFVKFSKEKDEKDKKQIVDLINEIEKFTV